MHILQTHDLHPSFKRKSHIFKIILKSHVYFLLQIAQFFNFFLLLYIEMCICIVLCWICVNVFYGWIFEWDIFPDLQLPQSFFQNYFDGFYSRKKNRMRYMDNGYPHLKLLPNKRVVFFSNYILPNKRNVILS